MNKLLRLSLVYVGIAASFIAADTGHDKNMSVEVKRPINKGVIEHITEVADFEAKTTTQGLVVVKFGAQWCGYCVKVAPVYEAIAKKYNDTIACYEVNTDDAQSLVKQQNIRGIPAFKIYKNGVKVEEFTGYKSQTDFEMIIERLLK